MKMMVISKTAVITLKDVGKLPGELKGRTFRYGLVIGPCRNLPVLLSHFQKEVILFEHVNSPGVTIGENSVAADDVLDFTSSAP